MIIIAILLAGNWFYNPFITAMDVTPTAEDYMPIAHYPESDPPDYVYNTGIINISVLNMSYVQYNYVWLRAKGHTPDEESIRIFIKDGDIHHISLSIHYQWTDVYGFVKTDNHIHINFLPVYHTPYVSDEQLIFSIAMRAIPFIFIFCVGIGFIVYDIYRERVLIRKKMKKKSIS